MVVCCFFATKYNCLRKYCALCNLFSFIFNPDISFSFDLSIFGCANNNMYQQLRLFFVIIHLNSLQVATLLLTLLTSAFMEKLPSILVICISQIFKCVGFVWSIVSIVLYCSLLIGSQSLFLKASSQFQWNIIPK